MTLSPQGAVPSDFDETLGGRAGLWNGRRVSGILPGYICMHSGAGCLKMTSKNKSRCFSPCPSCLASPGLPGRLHRTLLAAALLVLLLPPALSGTPALTGRVQEVLKQRAAEVEARKEYFCRREMLCGAKVLCDFYKNRDCRPVWLDDRGPLPRADDLARAIRRAELDGLTPEAYHLEAIETLLAGARQQARQGQPPDASSLAELDILLSDAFLIYGSHLLVGRVNPETVHAEWTIRSRGQDLAAILGSVLGEKNVEQALRELLPAQPGYGRLKEALARYRDLERRGGWNSVDPGPTLRPGERDERIPALRRRLAFTGDLESDVAAAVAVPGETAIAPRDSPAGLSAPAAGHADSDPQTTDPSGTQSGPKDSARQPATAAVTPAHHAYPTASETRNDGVLPAATAVTPDPLFFDAALAAAVIRFQQRHGLEPDGVVGEATLAALNVTAAERVRQLEGNLERLRWLPARLGERYILTNIAGYRLVVVEDGSESLSMRIVAGRSARNTPVLSGEIRYLVFNPYWTVPHKIASEDFLPKFRKNPEMVRRDGFRVFQGWGADAVEIAPESIDWSRFSRTYFPYRLRQDPGPRNSLGRVKFMFPNKHAVYLHDSPSRELFRKAKRNFSSGCIRVEKPLELADLLLKGNPSWTPEAIRAQVESGETREVTLPRSMPLYLFYWTAWSDPDGTVQFREDIYERDPVLDKALREMPPGPEPAV